MQNCWCLLTSSQILYAWLIYDRLKELWALPPRLLDLPSFKFLCCLFRWHDIFTKCHFFSVLHISARSEAEESLHRISEREIRRLSAPKPKKGLAFTFQPWEDFAILIVHYIAKPLLYSARSHSTPVSVSLIPACVQIFSTFLLRDLRWKRNDERGGSMRER